MLAIYLKLIKQVHKLLKYFLSSYIDKYTLVLREKHSSLEFSGSLEF